MSPANGVLVTWVEFSTLSSGTRAVGLRVTDAGLGIFNRGIRLLSIFMSLQPTPPPKKWMKFRHQSVEMSSYIWAH